MSQRCAKGQDIRVTFVIFGLTAGGAERVLSTMANYWAVRGWSIAIVTFVDDRKPPFYDLHPAVQWCPLALAGSPANPLRRGLGVLQRISGLRRALKESDPDLVISFMDQVNVLTLLASRRLNLPVIVSERIDPARQPIGPVAKVARRMLYPHASRVVVQTEAALRCFAPAVQQRGTVIPNPMSPAHAGPIAAASPAPECGTRLVAMGRLTRQKGFDLLLRAFAAVSAKYPAWSLTIWGEGEQRAALEWLRDDLGLNQRVSLPGLTTDPFQRMREASLFVLSSRFEGFPNALCEAMAAGLPAVSFDCPSGPAAIIRNDIDGVLVAPEDVPALAGALDRLMGDERTRRRLAQRAPEVLERFSAERIMGMWEEVIALV